MIKLWTVDRHNRANYIYKKSFKLLVIFLATRKTLPAIVLDCSTLIWFHRHTWGIAICKRSSFDHLHGKKQIQISPSTRSVFLARHSNPFTKFSKSIQKIFLGWTFFLLFGQKKFTDCFAQRQHLQARRSFIISWEFCLQDNVL